MVFQKAVIVLAFCVASCFATYGHNYGGHGHNGGGYGHNGGGHGGKVHVDNPKIHVDGPKIHLDNPSIILDRPSIIQVKDNAGHLHEDEPIILEHDKPLYIRKTLHGIPSGPIIINGGGHGHGHGYGGYGGKAGAAAVLTPAHVISAAPAVVAHDAAVLIRRPVHVSKELAPTQDHLEKLHFERLSHGGYSHGGYSHGHAQVVSAIPISKGLHENTVVYEKAEPIGHGLISFSAYHAPSALVAHPRAVYGLEHGHLLGGGLVGVKDGHGGLHHGNGGGYKKY